MILWMQMQVIALKVRKILIGMEIIMRKFISCFLCILLVISLFSSFAFAENGNEICMIGHKGYSACFQENTTESFRKAGEAGFGGAETDIRMTKDGVLVTCHDDEIETADGRRMKLSRYTYKELTAQPLKNDFTDSELYLCTLAQYFDICKEFGMFCFVEIKGYLPIWKIIEAFKIAEEHYDLSMCEFQSFELLVLFVAHIAFPELRIMLTTNTYNLNAKIALLLGFDIDINHTGINEEVVRKFHNKGLKVSTFTVNDKEELERVVSLGVDFVESDCFFSVDAS